MTQTTDHYAASVSFLAPLTSQHDPCLLTPCIIGGDTGVQRSNSSPHGVLSPEEVGAIAVALYEILPCDEAEPPTTWQLVGRARAVGQSGS